MTCYSAIRFRGRVWCDSDWHIDAFWRMLRELEPDPVARLEVWIPLLKMDVEQCEHGYFYSETDEFQSSGSFTGNY